MVTQAYAVFASRDQVAIREQDGAATAVLLEAEATAGRSTVIEIDAVADADVAIGMTEMLRYAFVVRGEWTLRIDDLSQSCVAGTTVQIPAGAVCHGNAATGGRVLVVALSAHA